MHFIRTFLILSIAIVVTISCSRSRSVISPYAEFEQAHNEEQADWIAKHGNRHTLDGIVYYVINDADFLYVLVEFTNRQFAQDAFTYGFTLYMDTDFKRSFGLTYPSGILHGLADYPGAYEGFLESPSWANNPENSRIIEMVEREMPDIALLTQNRSRRDNRKPAVISISELYAHNVDLSFDQTGRTPIITFRVPLESSRSQQFAIDTKPGEKIDLGFEVRPPDVRDLDKETSNTQRVRQDPYRQGGGSQQQTQNRSSNHLPSGFSYWNGVTLSDQSEVVN